MKKVIKKKKKLVKPTIIILNVDGTKQPFELKPRLEAGLKKLGIKTKFINNMRKQSNIFSKRRFIALDATDSLSDLINLGCVWGDSPEGHSFWCNIHTESYNV